MKFKTLKTVIASLVMTTTCFIGSANAGMITHSGYTHDTTTDIVTGGGLEWLQWDKTKGSSIASALGGVANTYLGGGWTLATNAQMAGLFNGFGLANGFTFGTDENVSYQGVDTYVFGVDPNDPEDLFNAMFGTSRGGNHRDSINGSVEVDGLTETSALYGTDKDGDGFYNIALVSDDWRHWRGPRNGYPTLRKDQGSSFGINRTSPFYGVALVRASVSVPEPSTFAIFALGMMGLASRRFKQKS